MNEGMLASVRALGVRVRLTLATGSVIDLDGGQVLSFSVEEGADSALLPGNVLSARLTLALANDAGQWRYGGSIRGERPLVGATAEVRVVCGEAELPCGAFVIDSVSAKERSGALTLAGSDSIASELARGFSDTLTYPATLAQVWAHLVSQTRYAWSGELPNGSAVIDAPPEWGEVTLRRAAGWIAQAAGCFVRVSRSGALEAVPCLAAGEEALSADDYLSLSDGFQTYGPVTAIQVAPAGDAAPFTVSDGPGETISVEDNPLFIGGASHVSALAEGMLAQISGLTLAQAEFTWRGDPAVGVGARIALTDTYGQTIRCTLTRQTMRFDGGFSAECVCEVPDVGDGGVMRAITPEGGVNAAALVGTVDGGLLAAGSVTARSIAAQAVTAEKLAAGSVSADHLAAGSVTAEKLDAESVSAKTAEFVAAEIEKLTADDVAVSALYAAFGHIVDLAVGSVSAGTVQADQLAAALAGFVSLYAGTGEFDFATVKNLVSKALSLEQGSAESVFIRNLAVTSANLLSATLGNLVLKGDDGGYYRVFVGADGGISAEEITIADGEIAAGQTSDGRQIVETGLNVGDLNATNLQASSAVINQILTTALAAEKITAADALIASATIPALYATAIKAIGDTIDISANRSITLLAGDVEAAQAEIAGKNAVWRQDAAPENAQVYDLWVQPSEGLTWQAIPAEEGLPVFQIDSNGVLSYEYPPGVTGPEYSMDEDGYLVSSDVPGFAVTMASDGRMTAWRLVQDAELRQAIEDNAESADEKITAMYTEVSVRQDAFDVQIQRKVDAEELQVYMRYGASGVLELGRSDSRYVSQTSDSGFVVLQDGQPMTSIVRNTVSAPVVEARRMFTLGNYSIRLGSGGGIIFN